MYRNEQGSSTDPLNTGGYSSKQFELQPDASGSINQDNLGGGLIDKNIQQPKTYDVQDKQLVQKGMTDIMSADNLMNKSVLNRANQHANKRGLINSSMAVQAGQEALLTNAFDIAKADADTYSNQALVNQKAENDHIANQNSFVNNYSLNDQAYQQEVGTGEYASGGLIDARLDAETALQDDSQEFTASENALQRTQETALQDDSQEFTSDENFLQRTQETDLQDDRQEFTSDESTLDRGHDIDLQANDQTNTQSNLLLEEGIESRLADLGYEHDVKSAVLEQQLELGVIDAEVYANTHGQYLAAVDEIIKQTQITVGEIQVNNEIAAADKTLMMADQAALLTTHLSLYKQLYEGTSTWKTGWVDLSEQGLLDALDDYVPDVSISE